MNGSAPDVVDLVVFFSKPVEADLPRLIHGLRAQSARARKPVDVFHHAKGTFLSFATNALDGSLAMHNQACGLSELNQALTGCADPAQRAAFERRLSAHNAHLRIRLSGTGDMTKAAKEIVKSVLGCLPNAVPLAVHDGHSRSLMSLRQVEAWLGRATRRIPVSAIGDSAPALMPGQIAPRRVDLPNAMPRRPRPGHTADGTQLRRGRSRLLAQLGQWPDLVNSGVGRIATGVLFGLLISGWAQGTFHADPAIAEPLAQTMSIAGTEPQMCGSQTPRTWCGAAAE